MVLPGCPDFNKQVLDAILNQFVVSTNPAAITAQVIKIVVVHLSEGQIITFTNFIPCFGWIGRFGGINFIEMLQNALTFTKTWLVSFKQAFN